LGRYGDLEARADFAPALGFLLPLLALALFATESE
jgi:hypothetical protein